MGSGTRPAGGRPARPALALDAGLIAGYASLTAALAWRMGQDLNYDLLNYHFYNAYQLLDGRLARDVHAAGVQSYLNPLLDLPLYAAVRMGAPPIVFFLSLAALQGLSLFLVHRLTVLLLPDVPARGATAAGVLAGVTAAFGAGFLSETGNSMHDSTLAVLVLGALWWVVASISEPRPVPCRVLVGAGLMAGAAAGLKLAMGALCIGLCAAVLASPGRPLERINRAAFVAVAVAAGVLLTGGLWMWLMYDHFGSPLFPFLNAAFASPFAPLENFADRRFMPRDTSQALFYPFYWLSMQSLVTEPVFRDGRIAAVYVCLAVLGVQAALDRVTGTPIQDRVQARRLLVIAAFCVASYGAWLVTFSIYRYLIPLELLSGVLILATTARVAPRWPWPLALALPVCVLLSLTARAPDWGRTAWSDSYFGVDTRALERYSDATILMWDFPQGYLAPLFPRSATFVRIRTNWGMTGTDRMWERVVGTIERTPDSRLYLMDLEPGSIHEEQPAALARLGLALDDGGCERYSSHSGGFRLCPVRRIPS